jgi:hypothetical protein
LESGVETGSWWWVFLSIWFAEDGAPGLVGFDLPSVFVEEPVVVSAEEDQIVQIGGSTISPVSDVMGVDEIPGSTTRETTAPIPIPELVT